MKYEIGKSIDDILNCKKKSYFNDFHNIFKLDNELFLLMTLFNYS